jgi:hypothetical protein
MFIKMDHAISLPISFILKLIVQNAFNPIALFNPFLYGIPKMWAEAVVILIEYVI